MNGHIVYNGKLYSKWIENIVEADFSVFSNIESISIDGGYISRDNGSYAWSMRITKNNIKIGCEQKSYKEFDSFFDNGKFIETNPAENPELWEYIRQRYEQAKIIRDKAFKITTS